MSKVAVLVLQDGSIFEGRSVGYPGRARGKVVPYAGISGFPDLMTDPSYYGKMLCFTYPHVGNPGVGPDDYQSDQPLATAAIMREVSAIRSNRLGVETFNEFLIKHKIPGIDGIDTRRLTRILYEKGPQPAALGAGDHANPKALLEYLDEFDPCQPVVRDFATTKSMIWNTSRSLEKENLHFRVVVYDFGVKRGFLRRLDQMGCEVKVVPYDHPVKDGLAEDIDGVIFSAGPGDPAKEAKAIKTAQALLGNKPLWGIGIGAGIIALAAGAKTFLDGRGHYGAHGVGRRDEPTGEMTMQCHDFWIEPKSLASAKLEMSHFHLNDKSVEGFESETLSVMGNLFHPEAEPGSRDCLYLFERFAELMRGKKAKWLGLI